MLSGAVDVIINFCNATIVSVSRHHTPHRRSIDASTAFFNPTAMTPFYCRIFSNCFVTHYREKIVGLSTSPYSWFARISKRQSSEGCLKLISYLLTRPLYLGSPPPFLLTSKHTSNTCAPRTVLTNNTIQWIPLGCNGYRRFRRHTFKCVHITSNRSSRRLHDKVDTTPITSRRNNIGNNSEKKRMTMTARGTSQPTKKKKKPFPRLCPTIMAQESFMFVPTPRLNLKLTPFHCPTSAAIPPLFPPHHDSQPFVVHCFVHLVYLVASHATLNIAG